MTLLRDVYKHDERLDIQGVKLPLHLFVPFESMNVFTPAEMDMLRRDNLVCGADLRKKNMSYSKDRWLLLPKLRAMGIWQLFDYSDRGDARHIVKGSFRHVQNMDMAAVEKAEAFKANYLLEEKKLLAAEDILVKQATDQETIQKLVDKNSAAHLKCVTLEDLYKHASLACRPRRALEKAGFFNVAQVCQTHLPEDLLELKGLSQNWINDIAFSVNFIGGYFRGAKISKQEKADLLDKSREWVRENKLKPQPVATPSVDRLAHIHIGTVMERDMELSVNEQLRQWAEGKEEIMLARVGDIPGLESLQKAGIHIVAQAVIDDTDATLQEKGMSLDELATIKTIMEKNGLSLGMRQKAVDLYMEKQGDQQEIKTVQKIYGDLLYPKM